MKLLKIAALAAAAAGTLLSASCCHSKPAPTQTYVQPTK